MIATASRFTDVASTNHRVRSEMDELEVVRSVRSLLRAVGKVPDREGLR